MTPKEVMLLRTASNRQISREIRDTMSSVATHPEAKTINVIKLISIFPKLQSIIYRHFLTDTDIKNNFRMYETTLKRFELHEQCFSWHKAFHGIRLDSLTHFAFTNSSQSFISDDITAFGKACPNITHLNLSGVSGLENE